MPALFTSCRTPRPTRLARGITESFGSFAGFKAHLTKAAVTTQGSGWGVLAYEPVRGCLIVEQVYDQKVDSSRPMWAVVNWQDVARRYTAAKERGDSLLLRP